MFIVQATATAQTAQSQSSAGSYLSSSSESYISPDTSENTYASSGGTTTTSIAVYPSSQGESITQTGEGFSINQNGTGSGSSSGSNSYFFSYSTSFTSATSPGEPNLSTSVQGSSSSSYSATSSYDGNNNSYGETVEVNGSRVTNGNTQTGSINPVILQTTASGTGGSSISLSTATHTFETWVPTLTTTVSGSLSGVTTTNASTTSSGITASADTSHYLNGVYSTTTQFPYTKALAIRTSAYVFAPNEDAWLIRLGQSFKGMQELSKFGSHLSDSSYEVPTSALSTVSIGIPATSTFQGVTQGLSQTTVNGTVVYVFQGSSSSTTGLATPPQGLPNTTQESDFTPLTSSSYTLTEYSVSPGGVTSTTGQENGQSASSVATVYANSTASSVIFAYDSRGEITGSSSSTLAANTFTTLSQLYPTTTGGDSSRGQGTSTITNDSGGGFGSTYQSGSTTAYGSTDTAAATAYSATSFLPVATILEATFDPAVRFGTGGKFDSIDGPGGSVYYPFWSQVWNDLWMPMTFRASTSTTYQNQSIVTETYDGGSYSYPTATGPTISASYFWSDSAVSMTTATSISGVTGSNSIGSGTTQFALRADGQDDASYFVSQGSGVGVYTSDPYGDTGIASSGSDYVVGGTQWADQPAQLWLGSGIWGLTSHDVSGGTSTTQTTITDPVSISMVPTSIVVAARPIPTWECVSANPGDPCLAVFIQGN